MGWPQSQEYNEAIQNAKTCFKDAELSKGAAVTNPLGMPLPCSGNFADVYQIHCPETKTRWAVKCFTRGDPKALEDRYAKIDQHLQQAKLPFAVGFRYLVEGIRIRKEWHPVLKMQWVEGFTLNHFVRDNLDKPNVLDALLQIWVRMGKRLREADMAHADLQHGNVLLVPGSTSASLAVKLIDYDGMWVPALAGKKSGEVGHPAYQHTKRLYEGTYSKEVDRFPLLVVATALRCLRVAGRPLWERFDNGDNLLFREADIAAPERSPLFAELKQIQDSQAQKLVETLLQATTQPLEDTPPVDLLLPDATAVKKGPPVPIGMPPAPEAAFADFGNPQPAKTPTLARQRSSPPSRNTWALIGVGAAALLMVVLIVAMSSGGKQGPTPPPNNPPPVGPTASTHLREKPSRSAAPALHPLAGDWLIRYANEELAVYSINHSGQVHWKGHVDPLAELQQQGGKYRLEYPGRRLELIELTDNTLHIEQYATTRPRDAGRPLTTGRGKKRTATELASERNLFKQLAGKWRIDWDNKTTWSFTFDEEGRYAGTKVVLASVEGQVWSNIGYVHCERFTLRDGKLHVEHWNPGIAASLLPRKPSNLGVGTRE